MNCTSQLAVLPLMKLVLQATAAFDAVPVRLEELMVSLPDCRLLVIDPVSAYLDGTESHNNADIRGLLAPLADFAARHDVAVVLIQHLNKSSGSSAMYRSMGSIAFVAAARAAYVVTKDQANPDRRLVMPVKNNLAKDSTGLAYSVLTAENGAPVIEWEKDAVTMTADEALAQNETKDEMAQADWAIWILEDLLADGPVKASVVIQEIKKAGITDKQKRIAQAKLKIRPYKDKTVFNGGWWWALPSHQDAHLGEDASIQTGDTLGDEGRLGPMGR